MIIKNKPININNILNLAIGEGGIEYTYEDNSVVCIDKIIVCGDLYIAVAISNRNGYIYLLDEIITDSLDFITEVKDKFNIEIIDNEN